MHLKRIMFCMVITFVFIMKARFVKAITLLLFNKTSLVRVNSLLHEFYTLYSK